MRAQMTHDTAARLAIGGKLQQFSGIYPGVVEEAWMSLATQQPLYLVGAFGGAAHAVIEALEGDASRLTVAMNNATGVEETLALATSRGMSIDDSVHGSRDDLNPTGHLLHPETMAHEIAARDSTGLEAALNNGLSNAENRELFHTAHPPLIAELVLTGVSRLQRT